jgi:hypothetical protein
MFRGHLGIDAAYLASRSVVLPRGIGFAVVSVVSFLGVTRTVAEPSPHGRCPTHTQSNRRWVMANGGSPHKPKETPPKEQPKGQGPKKPGKK